MEKKPEEKNEIRHIHSLERIVSRIFPSCFKCYMDQLIIESDEEKDLRDYIGFYILYSLAVGVLTFSISQYFIGKSMGIIFGIFGFAAIFIWGIVRLMLKSNNRARDIERDLPEILQMISANMRAGMTVEKAVTETVWPEFGILGKEINKIKIRLHTGKSFSEAFEEMSRTVNSESLKRAVKLLVEGNNLGGEMAQLVYDISKNLKETRELKEQIKSATTAYTIFILLGAIIITPILFSISVEYSTFTEKISLGGVDPGGIDIDSISSDAGSFGGIISMMGSQTEALFTSENIETFSLICIAIIAISSSFILSTIRAERTIAGIRYVPITLAISMIIYFISRFALSFVMGSLVTGVF